MADDFPSLKARELLKVLTGQLGYSVARQKGSHRRLKSAEGYPPLTFAFHDGQSLAPGLVRDVLVKQVGLEPDEALKLL